MHTVTHAGPPPEPEAGTRSISARDGSEPPGSLPEELQGLQPRGIILHSRGEAGFVPTYVPWALSHSIPVLLWGEVADVDRDRGKLLEKVPHANHHQLTHYVKPHQLHPSWPRPY